MRLVLCSLLNPAAQNLFFLGSERKVARQGRHPVIIIFRGDAPVQLALLGMLWHDSSLARLDVSKGKCAAPRGMQLVYEDEAAALWR